MKRRSFLQLLGLSPAAAILPEAKADFPKGHIKEAIAEPVLEPDEEVPIYSSDDGFRNYDDCITVSCYATITTCYIAPVVYKK